MKYISIGGVEVSQTVLGSMVFSIGDLKNSYDLLDRFFDVGGNAVDTAFIYGGGDSERVLGMWMNQRRNRSDLFVIGKGAHPSGRVPRARLSPEEIERDIDISLVRLQTDQIDLYLLHRDDEQIPVSTIIDYLNAEIGRGRLRAIGVSNWRTERIVAANDYARSRDLKPLMISSNNLSLAVPKRPHWGGVVCVDRPMWEWHNETQFPLLPWSSQARGFFSGKFSPEKLDDQHVVEIYYSDENFERLDRTKKLASEKNCTPIQISLAYVLHQPFPTFPIIGPRNLEELNSSLGAIEIDLTNSERLWLNLESDSR